MKYTLFYKQHFYKQHTPGWKWQKIKQKLSNTLRLNFYRLKIIHSLHPLFSSKTNLRYSKKCAKSKCIRFNQAIWLIAMKMRLKMKYGSHRHDINRTWLRHELKYTWHKMCLSMIMVLRNKQHLSNFWSWIHEKVKQHWGWVEKMCCL